jgi:probable addiction module antidote protein
MPRKSRPYEAGLHERLRDRSHAISYVKAAAADSIEGFLLALRDVADATLGMSKVAEASEKNRENLYRTLSEDGNPRLKTLDAVLGALGFHVSADPIVGVEESVPVAQSGGEDTVAVDAPKITTIDPSLKCMISPFSQPLSQQFTFTTGLWSARNNIVSVPGVIARNATTCNPQAPLSEVRL